MITLMFISINIMISHKNKRLDLSLSFRFANLTNNAQLDLKRLTEARPDGMVTVAVTSESGDRRTGQFLSNTSLSDVISKTVGTPKIKSGQDVAVLYMRTEIIGSENLETTTLRRLGLTSGNAALRVMVRDVKSIGSQAHVGETKLKKGTTSGPSEKTEQVTTQVKESVSKFGKSLKKMVSGVFDSSSDNKSSGQRLGTSGGEPSSSGSRLIQNQQQPVAGAVAEEDNDADEDNLDVNWVCLILIMSCCN